MLGTSSPVRVDIPADIQPTDIQRPAPLTFPDVDAYVAILEKQGQILEKMADHEPFLSSML